MTETLRVIAQPLTEGAYAPFGDVVMAEARGVAPKPANQGTARRYERLAGIKNLRKIADLNLSVFRCEARMNFPMELRVLEKHPHSTQLFVPMNAARYLVIVARGTDSPELSTLAAFVASGTQAISYHPGVWHHPMIALDRVTDFTCLVYEDGTSNDCTEAFFALGEGPTVVL